MNALILLLGALLVLGICVWSLARMSKGDVPTPDFEPCCHEMQVIAAKKLRSDNDLTVALYRCRYCGLHVSLIHTGYWELADFLRTESEIEHIGGTLSAGGLTYIQVETSNGLSLKEI